MSGLATYLVNIVRAVVVGVGSQGWMEGWGEAPHMLHTHGLSVAGLQVLVQDGEYLRVEHLEPPYSVDHPLQVLSTNANP